MARLGSRFGRLVVHGLLLVALPSFASAAAETRRVLVIHSFGNAAPPFTTHSTAFESELIAKMGEPLDLDEVSLDVARYTTLDMEEALIELMRKRQTRWQPDLVVPIGLPAGAFVAKYRDRLFPKATPIIYSGMDQRRLPPEALQQNATFVGGSLDLAALVEDMLQLAPATTNITVIVGASPFEQYWTAAMQRDWVSFTNRVRFTWLNDLPFDQMLERVATLPPRSFVFFALLMRDAAGVTHDADEALRRVQAVANAPINGVFQHQLGLGIVGGRLHRVERQGTESAQVAIRILRGEPASRIPPRVIGAESPQYDWRQLQRWNISADRLPPGSQVLFREPTVWERYRWRIIAVVALVLGEAVLILVLLVNLIQRRRLEAEARRLAAELAQLTRVNTLGALSGSLAHELNQPLGIILSNAQAAQELLAQYPPDTAELKDILADIVKADRRAGEVIERLRALFKGGPSSRQKLWLNAVIEDVLRLTRAELLSRGVSTVCDLTPELPPVTGDRVQLQQLLLNLILNAADAMAAKSPGKRRLHLRTMLQGERVRASVRDEGEGLPADVDRLFQPLYTTKPQGLGMGLAICRSIVDAHGGRLWAENHSEGGAVFHFELPVAEVARGEGSGNR
ncbi:MAG: ATPase [Verrucomicrobia bacterium]|nr:ATPase [Verrucomicrobiota bacterium]